MTAVARRVDHSPGCVLYSGNARTRGPRREEYIVTVATLTRPHTVTRTHRDFSGAGVSESFQVDQVVRATNGLVLGLHEGRTVKIWYTAESLPAWARDALANI